MVRTIAVLVLVARVAAAEELPGSDESLYSCKKRAAAIQVNLKPEIEVKELITWVVGFTCKQIVYDPRIISTGRKVTMIAPATQTPAEAYQLFVVALSTIGYTVVPKGKTLRIVEAATAPGETVPIWTNGKPEGDSVVRYVMRPTYAQPDTLNKALTAMKSKDGNVTQVGSLLVITDYASNVRDMLSITKLVDVPGGSEGIYTIPLLHADAAKLADKLTTLLAPAKTEKPELATAAPSKILVDERTNTLIVAASAAGYDRVKALVERLDIALDIEGGTSIHVYQLGSAIAEELAKTINDAIQNQPQKDKTATHTTPVEGVSLEGQARVIGDTPTNKLIVMSSGRDFVALREVIRELDVPRRQVYVEASVVEIEVGTGLDAGTSSHGGLSLSNGQSIGIAGVQTPNLRSLDLTTLTAASGLIGGLVGKTIANSTSLLGKTIPSYTVLFQALAQDSRTNVLSTPSILVLDNEQAKYKVGTDVPYKKGVMPTSPTSTSSVTTNIDRKQLVLELDIKPHISTDDSILLELKLSSDDPGDKDPELGPSWSTRAFESRVLVHDQQTVVISGLMQERDISTTAKVPLLGDIPILGYLFKYATKSKKKTNLLVTLTPYIIKDQADLEMIRERKQREQDEFVGSIHALDGMKYQPRIDYRRKRGLIEEINRTLQDVEADTAARATLSKPVHVTSGLVEPAPASP